MFATAPPRPWKPPPKFVALIAVLPEKTQSVVGMIDQKSQRTAWTIEGQQWPIMETGLSNLTEDTAAALVHFEDGQTQQWLLVRLEEPKEGEGSP